MHGKNKWWLESTQDLNFRSGIQTKMQLCPLIKKKEYSWFLIKKKDWKWENLLFFHGFTMIIMFKVVCNLVWAMLKNLKFRSLMDFSGDLKLLLTYSCVKMSRSTSKHSIFPSISCLMNDSVQTNAHTNFLREDVWITALFCRKVKIWELLTRCFKVKFLLETKFRKWNSH